MRIVHVSDIHFGTETAELVAGLVERARALAPDLIIASGDFTMAGRPREFIPAARLLSELGGDGTPVIATPGNHDLPVYNLWDRFVRPFARYQKWIEPVSQRAFVDERAAVLSLNSARRWDLSLNWSHGRLSRSQILEADRFFAGAQDAAFRALAVHHPFHVPEQLPGFRTIGRGEAMLDVLAKRRVHAVFSGHLHLREVIARRFEIEADAERGSWEVSLVQAGTATSTRGREDAERNSFNRVEVGADGSFRVVAQVWDGQGFRDAPGAVAEGAADAEAGGPRTKTE